MDSSWQAYLQSRTASIHDGCVVHFGSEAVELRSLRSRTVMADLSHFGAIRFSGEDAQSFLQGQLSCDVAQLDSSTALYGSYCNPKGRILASFLIWKVHADFIMQLPRELQAGIQKRLSMYVLRSKVKLSDDADSLARIGLSGENAGRLVSEAMEAIEAMNGVPPLKEDFPLKLGAFHGERASVLRLAADRFELVTSAERAPELWDRLSRAAAPVGASCWSWLDIRAGIPVITSSTQEQFIPQMVNLEAIGGVSFRKGCYPGQEIVARTQYLGKIKRRMYLANIRPHSSFPPVAAGDELFSAEMEDQPVGVIVNAANSPDGGVDVLAVVQTAWAGEGTEGKIRWRSFDGPPLVFMFLPYSVED
jgi:folate-binding protein YgfZ